MHDEPFTVYLRKGKLCLLTELRISFAIWQCLVCISPFLYIFIHLAQLSSVAFPWFWACGVLLHASSYVCSFGHDSSAKITGWGVGWGRRIMCWESCPAQAALKWMALCATVHLTHFSQVEQDNQPLSGLCPVSVLKDFLKSGSSACFSCTVKTTVRIKAGHPSMAMGARLSDCGQRDKAKVLEIALHFSWGFGLYLNYNHKS